MKKQAFARFARKTVAMFAAGALAISMLGLSACADHTPSADPTADEATTIEEEAAPLAVNDSKLAIKAGAATPVSGKNNTYSFPNLTVEANGTTAPIKSITVQFTSGITDGDDVLLASSGDFQVLDTKKIGNKTVNNTTGASAEVWAKYLQDNLQIVMANQASTTSLRMIASFDPQYRTLDYNSLNGHYYEVGKKSNGTADVGQSWSYALKQAEKCTYMGMKGYLVTVTSEEEQKFVFSLVNTDTWIGGTCDDTYTRATNAWAKNYRISSENPQYSKRWATSATYVSGGWGQYYWVSGPEAGLKMGECKDSSNRKNATNPETGEPMYMNWSNSQPDGCKSTGEKWMQLAVKYGTNQSGGPWNDLPEAYSNMYYIIEYGGMPDDIDPENDNSGDVYVKVDIDIDPTGETLTTEAYNVTVGDKLDIRENVNGDPAVVLHEVTDDGSVQPVMEGGSPKPSPVTRTFEIKDPATGQWRALTEKELNDDGEPFHAGTYRVTSSALWGHNKKGEEIPYKSKAVQFNIKPKVLMPVVEKTYDGTKDYSLDALDVTEQILKDAKVTMTADKAVTFNDCTVAGAKEAYLTGAQLTGVDAADYALPATAEDGKFIVPGKIVPRELEVQAIATVNWGLAGEELKDESGDLITFKNNLAIHKDGDWAKNELAERDAKSLEDTILGAVSYTELSGTTALNPTNPEVGHYSVVAHFANVNPAGASAADEGKQGQSLAMMADEGEVVEQTEVQPNAAAPTTPAAGALDTITATKIAEGRYDIGNYILTLKDAGVVVTDNPLNEDGYDIATKFLGDIVNEKVDPDADPLTQNQLLDLVKELFGSDLPSGVTPKIVVTDKDGKVVETIDPTKVGSYAIVATYPNPDGEDTVVRVGYNVLQNDPIVEKQSITVKAHEGAEPVDKDDLKKLADNIMGDWLPKGVNPSVIITDKDGKQISEIPMDRPGEYKVTMTYIDDNGVVRQVVLDYKVDPDQEEEVIEDLRKPTSDGEPMTKKDIFDDIMDRYSPDIIPADITDYEITIVGPDGPTDTIDPSIPGTYTVTMTYTDEFGNKHIVRTTYTFFEPDEGMDRQASGTDPSTGDGDNNGGMDRQAAGTDPSFGSNGYGTGSDFNGGTSGSKGWDNANGQKGFADRLLAQTGDPVFWVVCGVVVVAVAAGVVLVVARRKNKKQQ